MLAIDISMSNTNDIYLSVLTLQSFLPDPKLD
jgi:hypothetical protein